MNSTAKNKSCPQRLPVQWLEAPVVEFDSFRGAHAPSRVVFGASPNTLSTSPLPVTFSMVSAICSRSAGRRPLHARARALPVHTNYRQNRSRLAFTLLELMLVITIIGLIAGMTLTHLGNFGHSNSMTTATRQLLDDVALARQRAMVNRSTVYMVFLPPMFWTNSAYNLFPASEEETNLLMHQYSAYALVSLSSVGDQPGQHNARYLTDWRFLPSGVFFAPLEFTNPVNIYVNTTNTLSGTINTGVLQTWKTVYAPFPSLSTSNTSAIPLPCIAFTPQGSLTTQYPQYIALARGSIFYPTDTNGVPLELPPNVAEAPPANDMSNPNLIQIDWLTARATLMQNQLQ